MNPKQLTTLVLLGLVIGGLGLFITKRNASSWNRNEGGLGQKVLGTFDINDVTHIVIKTPTNELNLVKEDVWKVKERHGYPANFGEIGDFLRKIAELKTVQPVKVGPSQLGRLELLSPEQEKGTNAGTLVELKTKDKTAASLLLGKKSMTQSRGDSPFGGGGYPNGRYVMVPGGQGASLVSEAFSEIEPKGERWLNKDFFKVEKLKSIAISSQNPPNNWKIARDSEAGSWALVDKKEGEQIETNKLSGVGYALSSPSFNDIVAPDAKSETTGLDKPLTATLETFDGFAYTVQIGGKTGEDNHHLKMSVAATFVKERTPGKDEKPEDKEKLDKEFKEKVQKLEDKLKQEKSCENWIYLVSKWTIDPLLKERKEFFVEKKEEEKKPETGNDQTVPPLPDFLEAPKN